MLPLLLNLYVSRIGPNTVLQKRIDSEINNHLSYLESKLTGKTFLLGDEMSAADIMMSFVGEIAVHTRRATDFPAIHKWVQTFQARPAYKKALEKGGPYIYAKI